MIKKLRWALASEIGTSHLKSATRKQDWARIIQFKYENLDVANLSIISDGAGSASMGGEGAALVCYSIAQKAKEHFKQQSEMPSDDEIWSWLDYTRDLISDSATKRNLTRKDFSATLIALIVTDDDVIVFHVGDGAVVARRTDAQWISLSWPETGEYASTTYFVIDDPLPRLKISRFKNEFDAFSLFSDGIENLALDFKENRPHPPFFNSLLRSVDESTSFGNIKTLSEALSEFLNNEKINERTDDDKSLIIISTK